MATLRRLWLLQKNNGRRVCGCLAHRPCATNNNTVISANNSNNDATQVSTKLGYSATRRLHTTAWTNDNNDSLHLNYGTAHTGTVNTGTVHNGTVNNTTVHNGTVNNTTVHNDTANNATVHNDTVNNTTVDNGTVDNGTVHNGTVDNGTVDNGTVHNGTVDNGTVHNGTIHFHTSASATPDNTSARQISKKLKNGPGLEHFIANSGLPQRPLSARDHDNMSHPYIQPKDISGQGRKVYFDMYGCQMNVSDTEIAWSVLKDHGYARAKSIEEADVVLVMTCAIREGAEDKVWNKLKYLANLKKKRMRKRNATPVKIGVLGCMAERLKKKLVEQEKSVDVVAGPDSYRDLARLLALVDEGETAVNVLLSMDETYADIVPLSLTTSRMSAFISIMRGCDNMCSYCIVPFTRGKERSRDIQSILEETRHLADEGVKEITLLGQNVNSYRDVSYTTHQGLSLSEMDGTSLARGFKTVYKPKKGGLRFADLLDKVSQVNPEVRIRFTSPHPKDFPDEVLYLIKERGNICKQIHLPAQCGSTRVLELMRRGYSREAYLDLVEHIRSVIPSVSLSSDFICGFCSETESEFQETLSLLEAVKYNFCYLFPYSLREKTHAHRRLVDDVPQPVKLDRLNRMVTLFRSELVKINRAQIGQQQLVLVEGTSKRSELQLVGRNDGNTRVIFPNVDIEKDGQTQKIQPGDYISVMITDSSSQVLKGIPLTATSLQAGA